jgi:ATP-dependent Zn protease
MSQVSKKLVEDESMSGRAAKDRPIFSYIMSKIPRLMLSVATLLCFMYLFTYLVNSAQNKMGEKYKFEVKTAADISQRLDDVKGIDEIKEEIINLIKMVKDPFKYKDKGAKLHRGVMLFGEPGVGKTLLARAIAGEAGTNFIFCSGS